MASAAAWLMFFLGIVHVVFGLVRFKDPVIDAVAAGRRPRRPRIAAHVGRLRLGHYSAGRSGLPQVAAAAIAFVVGLAHCVLGEKLIFQRLRQGGRLGVHWHTGQTPRLDWPVSHRRVRLARRRMSLHKVFAVAPNLLLSMLLIPPTSDVWIHVVILFGVADLAGGIWTHLAPRTDAMSSARTAA